MNMKRALFDSLDYRILQKLQSNIRADAAKIARSLGANERTVRKRINRLISLNAVDFTAVINPQTFGYITLLEAILEVVPEYEQETLNILTSMPEICYMAFGQNDRELKIQAHFKNNLEMRSFLHNTLSSIPGVSVVQAGLVPQVLRNRNTWMPDEENFAEEEDEKNKNI